MEFLSLVAAIFIADGLFEITKLTIAYFCAPKKRLRDARGRFVRVEYKGLRRVV